MDSILVIIGFCCMLIGVIGSFLPVVPGAPMSWVGLALLYFTTVIPANYWVLSITLLVTIITSILEYIIPSRGTKRFGGSSYGIWGTNIGLVAGLLSPIPFGFLIGAFTGALIGELLHDSKNHKRAWKAAAGSFIGFLASSFMQFLICVLFLGLYISLVWRYKEVLF
jgi:uncharacterized protein YqgC (DUF456 family)